MARLRMLAHAVRVAARTLRAEYAKVCREADAVLRFWEAYNTGGCDDD